jgi:hypothetical protein
MSKDFEQSESGNWNIADFWSTHMIAKPLYLANEALRMAKKGCVDIEEDFVLEEDAKAQARIKGLIWAKDYIEEAIRHSLFAIRKKDDKTKVKNFLEEIIKLQKYMKLIRGEVPNREKTKLIINEEIFDLIYNKLIEIKTEINEPLNRSDLIFMFKEEFNPKEYKSKIKEELIEEG